MDELIVWKLRVRCQVVSVGDVDGDGGFVVADGGALAVSLPTVVVGAGSLQLTRSTHETASKTIACGFKWISGGINSRFSISLAKPDVSIAPRCYLLKSLGACTSVRGVHRGSPQECISGTGQ